MLRTHKKHPVTRRFFCLYSRYDNSKSLGLHFSREYDLFLENNRSRNILLSNISPLENRTSQSIHNQWNHHNKPCNRFANDNAPVTDDRC